MRIKEIKWILLILLVLVTMNGLSQNIIEDYKLSQKEFSVNALKLNFDKEVPFELFGRTAIANRFIVKDTSRILMKSYFAGPNIYKKTKVTYYINVFTDTDSLLFNEILHGINNYLDEKYIANVHKKESVFIEKNIGRFKNNMVLYLYESNIASKDKPVFIVWKDGRVYVVTIKKHQKRDRLEFLSRINFNFYGDYYPVGKTQRMTYGEFKAYYSNRFKIME